MTRKARATNACDYLTRGPRHETRLAAHGELLRDMLVVNETLVNQQQDYPFAVLTGDEALSARGGRARRLPDAAPRTDGCSGL